MKRLIVLSIMIIFSLSFSRPGWCGYDKTNWGMTLATVKKLYPGGVAKKLQTQETNYSVVRPVAGLSTGYIMFTFSSKLLLTGVIILFPVQGAEIDLEKGIFDVTVNSSAKSIFSNLNTALTIKYGKPEIEDDSKKAWNIKDDVIVLNISPSEDGVHSTTSILYQKIQKLKELSNGL